MNNTLVYNAHLVDETLDCSGAVLLSGGTILSVFTGDFSDSKRAAACCGTDGTVLIDARGYMLMPAFIDMHVHFRYPGQTEKEDLDTGLHAAVAGGYSTVFAMPNTNPVISSYEQALEVERKAASYGLALFFQTVSLTNNFAGTDTTHLDNLRADCVPIISEDGHDVASSAVLFEAMKKAAEKGILVSCHSEDPTLSAAAKPFRERALALMREYGIPAWGKKQSEIFVPESVNRSITDSLTEANRLLELAEDIATERNLAIAKAAGCRVHIAHVSTKGSIEAVCRAKNDRPAMVSCEVTPHHIALTGTEPPLIRALVNPPLRKESDRIALISALQDGIAEIIATDHAPHTIADKMAGAPGFTGLETAYSVCNTILVRQQNVSSSELSSLMSAAPARLLHLNKGRLLPGYDADLVLVDPSAEWVVSGSEFASKGKATPFDGGTVQGRVLVTVVNGREVFRHS